MNMSIFVGVGVTLNSLGKVYHELGLFTRSLVALQRSQNITANFYCKYPNHPQVITQYLILHVSDMEKAHYMYL